MEIRDTLVAPRMLDQPHVTVIDPGHRSVGFLPSDHLTAIMEDERIAHLTRCPEHACVVPISPHASCAPERAVDGSCYPDRKSLDTSLEPRRLVRFRQQVQMILLHAEMENAEAMVAGGPERSPDRAEGTLASE